MDGLELANSNVDNITNNTQDNISSILKQLDDSNKQSEQDFSLIRTAEQLAYGWLSGFTAFPIGEKPHNTAEGIARSIGHLGGFIGMLFPGVEASGVVSSKLEALSLALGRNKKYGELLGPVTEELAKTAKIMSGFKSVPMKGADMFMKSIEKFKIKDKTIAEALGEHSIKLEQAYRSGMHLGAASAVSELYSGVGNALISGIYGGIFGGAFSVIGNLPFAKDDVTGATVLKAIAGSLTQGLPAQIQGADTPTLVYNYLLGAYFGATSQSAEKFKAMDFLSGLKEEERQIIGKVDKDGNIEPGILDTLPFKEEYSKLNKETRKEVSAFVNKLYSHKEAAFVIRDVLEGLAKHSGKQVEEVFGSMFPAGRITPVEEIKQGDWVRYKDEFVPREVEYVDEEGVHIAGIKKPYSKKSVERVDLNAEEKAIISHIDSGTHLIDTEMIMPQYTEGFDSMRFQMEHPVRSIIKATVGDQYNLFKADVIQKFTKDIYDMVESSTENPEKNAWKTFKSYLEEQSQNVLGKPLTEEALMKAKQLFYTMKNSVKRSPHYFNKRTGKLEPVKEDKYIPGVGYDPDGNRILLTIPKTVLHEKYGEDVMFPISFTVDPNRKQGSRKLSFVNYKLTDTDKFQITDQLDDNDMYLFSGAGDKPEYIAIKYNLGDYEAEKNRIYGILEKKGFTNVRGLIDEAGNQYYITKGSTEEQRAASGHMFEKMFISNVRYWEDLAGRPIEELLGGEVKPYSLGLDKKTTKLLEKHYGSEGTPKEIANKIRQRDRTLTVEEIQQLPGIGPKRAKDILSAINSSSKQKLKAEGDFITDPVNFNKRLQILFTKLPRVDEELWEEAKEKFNLNDKAEKYILAYDPEELGLGDAESTDGMSEVLPEVLKAERYAMGMKTEGGFVKPFAVVRDEENGTMLTKTADHALGDKSGTAESMREHGYGRIIYHSSAKMYGKRQMYHVEFNKDTNRLEYYIIPKDKNGKLSYKDRIKVKPEEVKKYRLDPRDFAIMTGKIDYPEKNTTLFLQMSNAFFKYIGDVDPELVDAYQALLNKIIEGNPKYNEQIVQYKGDPEKFKDLEEDIVKHFNEVDPNLILDILNDPKYTKGLAPKLITKILLAGNNVDQNGKERFTDQEENTIIEGNNPLVNEMSGVEAYIRAFKGDRSSLSISQTRRFLESSIAKWLTKRITTPRWKYSGESVLRGKNSEFKATHDIGENDIYLDEGYKENFKGKFLDEKGVEQEMTLAKAWDIYQKVKESNPALAKRMKLKFRIVTGRAPIDDALGVPVLNFKGWTGAPGGGAIVHDKVMKQLGGADLDIDSIKQFQNLPGKYIDALSRLRNVPWYDLSIADKAAKISDPEGKEKRDTSLLKLFVRKIDNTSPLANTALEMFDSSSRVKIGEATSLGRGFLMGTISNVKTMVGSFLSSAYQNGGVYESEYNDGYITDKNTRFKLVLYARQDKGEAFRFVAAAEQNMSVDLAKLNGEAYTPAELRAAQLVAAFKDIKLEKYIKGDKGNWYKDESSTVDIYKDEKIDGDSNGHEALLKAIKNIAEHEKLINFMDKPSGKKDGLSPQKMRDIENARREKALKEKKPYKPVFSKKAYDAAKKRYTERVSTPSFMFTDMGKFSNVVNKVFGRDSLNNRRYTIQEVAAAAKDYPYKVDSFLKPVANFLSKVNLKLTPIDYILSSGNIEYLRQNYIAFSQVMERLEKIHLYDNGKKKTIGISWSAPIRKLIALQNKYIPVGPLDSKGPTTNLFLESGRQIWSSDPEAFKGFIADLLFDGRGKNLNINDKAFIGKLITDAVYAAGKKEGIEKSVNKLLASLRKYKEFRKKKLASGEVIRDPEEIEAIISDNDAEVLKFKNALMSELVKPYTYTDKDGQLRFTKGASHYEPKFRRQFIDRQITEVNDFFGNDVAAYASLKLLADTQKPLEAYLNNEVTLTNEKTGEVKKTTLDKYLQARANDIKRVYNNFVSQNTEKLPFSKVVEGFIRIENSMLNMVKAYNEEAAQIGNPLLDPRAIKDYYYALVNNSIVTSKVPTDEYTQTRTNMLGANILPRYITEMFADNYTKVHDMFLSNRVYSRKDIQEFLDQDFKENYTVYKSVQAEVQRDFFLPPTSEKSELSPEAERLKDEIIELATSLEGIADNPELVPGLFRALTGKVDANSMTLQDLKTIKNRLTTFRNGPIGFDRLIRMWKANKGEKQSFAVNASTFFQFVKTVADKELVNDIILKQQDVFNDFGEIDEQAGIFKRITNDGKIQDVYANYTLPFSYMHELINHGNKKTFLATQSFQVHMKPIIDNILGKYVLKNYGVDYETGSDKDKHDMMSAAIKLFEYDGARKYYKEMPNSKKKEAMQNVFKYEQRAEKAFQLRKDLGDRKYIITDEEGKRKTVTGNELIDLMKEDLGRISTALKHFIEPSDEQLKDSFTVSDYDFDLDGSLKDVQKVFAGTKVTKPIPYEVAAYLAHEFKINEIARQQAHKFSKPTVEEIHNTDGDFLVSQGLISPMVTPTMALARERIKILPKDSKARATYMFFLEQGLNREDLKDMIWKAEYKITKTGHRIAKTLSTAASVRLMALKDALKVKEYYYSSGKVKNKIEFQKKISPDLSDIKTLRRYFDRFIGYNNNVTARLFTGNKGHYSQYEQDLAFARGELDRETWLKRMLRFNGMEYRGINMKENYFPHMGFRVADIRSQIDAMAKDNPNDTELLARLLDTEDRLLNENSSETGNLSDDVIDQISPTEELSVKDILQRSIDENVKTGNLLDRSYDLDGYLTDITVWEKAYRKINDATFSTLTAVMGKDTINRYEKGTTMEGVDKDKMLVYMNQYLRNVLGNPSIFTDNFLSSEMGKWLKKTPYYFFTDDFVARHWGKFRKLFLKYKPDAAKLTTIEHIKLTQELGHPPTTEELAKAEEEKLMKLGDYKSMEAKAKLAKMIRGIAQQEGRYEMMTLLTAPKTGIANIMSGLQNTYAYTGLRAIRDASKLETWTGHGLRFNGAPVKSMEDVHKWVASQGIFEDMLIHDVGLNMESKYRHGRYKDFTQALVDKLSKDPLVKDATLSELANEYNVSEDFLNKIGYIMRKTERLNRSYSFLASLLAQRESWITADVPIDSAMLVERAKRGVEITQFLYDAPNRFVAAQTPLGTMFNRFKLWAYSSAHTRKVLLQEAMDRGITDSVEHKRFLRMAGVDLFLLSLATLLPYTMFDYSLAAPYSWLQSLADWIFGDDKERERAFFTQSFGLPTALGPLAEVLPPMARIPKATYDMGDTVFKVLFGGEVDKTAQYTIYSLFPFGRIMKDGIKSFNNPSMATDFMLGLPLHRIGRVTRKVGRQLVDNDKHIYFAFRPPY